MALLLVGVAPARAQLPAAPPPEPAPGDPAPAIAPAPVLGEGGSRVRTVARPEPELSHRHQFGLAVMPGVGYRIVVPYKDNIPCGDSSGNVGKRVCTSRSPVFLELQAAFGLHRRIDLIVDTRFGLEVESIDMQKLGRQFMIAPGLRIWLDYDRALKFYTTLQGVFDSTDYSKNRVSSSDFGFRNANGLMYDLIRNFGFYFQFGETFGFKRWFRIEVDVGAGVQVRFP